MTAGPMLAPRAPFVPLAGAGVEWVVEAFACDPRRLRDLGALSSLVDAMVVALQLTPVADVQWHRFPEPGGITGLLLLAESHLALHTFPEHASLCLNLFCCRPRPEWEFERGLASAVGASRVRVRRIDRVYGDIDLT